MARGGLRLRRLLLHGLLLDGRGLEVVPLVRHVRRVKKAWRHRLTFLYRVRGARRVHVQHEYLLDALLAVWPRLATIDLL